MASGTYSSPKSPPAKGVAESERYVVEQLDRAGRYLKLVELFGGLLLWAIGVLAFLLLVVIVDAWVLELGVWARIGTLILLAAGSLAYFALVMFPLLWRRINPAYAARTIEQCEPTLKNSLINFLSFRAHREGLHDVVYSALEHRAAADLSHTPVESTIDYTRLLRIGYVLAGLLLACGLYTVVSPKKPFATLQRVMSPFSEVARPSVVEIARVEPGNAEVFHGDRVQVSASIRGLSSDQPAIVRYSSVDGQIVDMQLEMKADQTGTHFEVALPPGEEGVQQDLRYRLEAGDARSPDYTLRMIPAPRINVRKLEYDYPGYTRRPDRVVEDEGDIKAVEGTRVTVHARANQPIKSAYIELLPDAAGEAVRPVSVPMEHAGEEAWGSFILKLQADRRTPRFGSYRVRYRTAANHLSRVPTVHRIDVTPDLPPEVEVLQPKSNRTRVPENGSQQIEIRALDPDYGLRQVVLIAEVGGTRLFEEKLLDDSAGHVGQISKTYEFIPKTEERELAAGIEVVFWAEAKDNRTVPGSETPEPNTARTENFFLEIVKPADPRPDTPKPPHEKSKKDKPEEAKKDDDAGSSESSEEERPGSETGSGESGTGAGETSGENSSGEGENASGESGEGSSSSGSSGNSGASQGQPTEGDPGDGSSRGTPSEGESSGDAPSNSSGQGEEQTDAGGGKGDPSSDGSAGGDRTGGERSGGGERTEPLHDGEVIERVLKHKRRQEQLREGSGDGRSERSGDGRASQDDAGEDQTSAGGEQPGGEKKNGGSADGDKPEAGDNSAGGKSGDASNNSQGESAAGENPSKPNGGGDSGQQDQPTGGSRQGQPQDGGEKSGAQSVSPSGDGQEKGGGQKKDGQQQDGGSESGGGQNPSGGGMKDGQQQPSGGGATSQGQNREKKDGGGSAGGSQPKDGGQSPSNSQNQSSGEGDQGGDKSGGGSKGGGQDNPQPGQGGAGGSTPSDSGSGAADEPGDGETADKPGGKRPGDTGSGNREGAGSASGGKQGDGDGQSGTRQPGEQQPGQAPGEKPKDPFGKPDGDTSRRESDSESSAGDSSSESAGSRTAGSNTSRGSAGGSSPSGGFDGEGTGDSPSPPDGEAPDADEAKLEYAEEATDLVLDYLRDQKNKRDPELLDELDMTEEELERFVERWESMKRGAREGEVDPESYSDALRSLGLRRQADRRRAVGAKDDALRGADSGVRSEPPPAFLEQFRAFKSGAARAEDERSRDK